MCGQKLGRDQLLEGAGVGRSGCTGTPWVPVSCLPLESAGQLCQTLSTDGPQALTLPSYPSDDSVPRPPPTPASRAPGELSVSIQSTVRPLPMSRGSRQLWVKGSALWKQMILEIKGDSQGRDSAGCCLRPHPGGA